MTRKPWDITVSRKPRLQLKGAQGVRATWKRPLQKTPGEGSLRLSSEPSQGSPYKQKGWMSPWVHVEGPGVCRCAVLTERGGLECSVEVNGTGRVCNHVCI